MIYINLTLFFLFYYFILHKIIKEVEPYYWVILAYYLFDQIWQCASVLYLSTGAISGNYNIATNENLSFITLLFLQFIFDITLIKVLLKSTTFIINKKNNSSAKIHIALKVISVVLIVMFFIEVLKVSQINYFLSRAEYKTILTGTISGLIIENAAVLAAILGFASSKFEKEKLFTKVILVSTIVLFYVCFIILGNKFSIFILITTIFLMTNNYFYKKIFEIWKSKSYSKLLIWGFVIFVPFMLWSISYFSERYFHINVGSMGDYLVGRIFRSQGDTFWLSWDEVLAGRIDYLQHLGTELNAIIFHNVNDYDLGLKYLMIHYGGSSAINFINTGFVYTGGFPAILFHIFPFYIVPFFMIFSGYILAKVMVYFKLFTNSNIIIGTLLLTVLWNGVNSFIMMGNLNALFSIRDIISFLLIFILNQSKVKYSAYRKFAYDRISE